MRAAVIATPRQGAADALAGRWLLLAWFHYLGRVRRLSMNEWLQATPLLVFFFLALMIVVPALIKRRMARNYVPRPHLGDTIPELDDKTPIEDS